MLASYYLLFSILPFESWHLECVLKVEDIVAELMDEVGAVQNEGIEKMLPVTLDSVHFKCGTLMLLAYGDREPR